MTVISPFSNILAEADFRKHVELAGPLDLIVDAEAAEEIAKAVEARGLSSLITVIGLSPDAVELPDALAPEAADSTRPLWIFSPEHEERLLTRLAGKVGRPVWGFYKDVYGAANAGPVLAERTFANREDIDAYAIACTARSGSTYVCELLARNGGAKPKEHLRPPVIDMLASAPDGKRQAAFIDAVVLHGQKNGVFGTKLIEHFCSAAIPYLDLPALQRDIDSFKSFRIVYLIREDKVLQAISTERAKQTNIYHVRAEKAAAQSAQAKKAYEYDYEALRLRVDALHEEEEELQAAIKAFPYEVLVVGYEKLVKEPEAEMQRILDFLHLQSAQITTSTRIVKIGDEETDRIADRFCEEFAEKTGSPARRYFESSIASPVKGLADE